MPDLTLKFEVIKKTSVATAQMSSSTHVALNNSCYKADPFKVCSNTLESFRSGCCSGYKEN